jgi:hypothetical protein
MADKYVAHGDAIALAAATAKTVLAIGTPGTIRARLCEITVGLDGVTAANPAVFVELLRQTTAGTNTSMTPIPVDSAAPSSLVTAGKNHSAEPTAGVVIKTWRLTPVGGLLVIPFYGDEQVVVPVSSWLGLRLTASAIVNANASMTFLA